MKRRDAIRRALGTAGSLSVVALSGRLVTEDDSASTDADAATAGRTAPEEAALDEAASDEASLDGESEEVDDEGAPEAVTEQLRQTHEERCQCPVCGGSMPGRG
ncbi:hypothetical protein [Halorubrum tibetense]|uniref:Uncharacterized protein n=1 Tax=Halorubrum tibetense TaxID=175631 RepID=A0ABD5SBQ0_9EURY